MKRGFTCLQASLQTGSSWRGGGRVELDFGLTVPVRLMPCYSSTCGLDHCGCELVVFVVCNIGGLVRDFAVILGLFWCSFGEII